MKYIAPGGWFSLEYPAGWREFEDTEESFYFMTPTNGVEISVSRLIEVLTQTMEKNVSVMN